MEYKYINSNQQLFTISNQKLIINKTADYVKEKLENDSSGHDWWHIYRVWKNAITIAEDEAANLFVVQLAALLHDIGDWKMHGGDETVGILLSREWLTNLKVEEDIILNVCQVISEISFKGAAVNSKPSTIEGMIVQDADRLDAMGAIGIARAFAYGGYKGRAMYDPNIKAKLYSSFEEYKSNESPTLNHFYEKLLLLKDLINTGTAKKIAEKRHLFMEVFLQKFFTEWEGEDFNV